jgi:CheY-like chemotaxis protein
MVIEDNPAVRSVVTRLLRLSGFAILDAATAPAGLELARLRKPDMLVTDLVLPGMSGVELLRHFRRDPELRDIPTLVISGRADAEAVEEIRALGGRFVPKPFQAAAIVGEIRKLIDAT